MGSTEDMTTSESSSLRMSRAVNDLVEASGTGKALAYVEKSAAEYDETFTFPEPMEWLDSKTTAQAQDPIGWVDNTDTSRRTGLVRTYSGDPITGTQTANAKLNGLRFTHKDNIGVKGYPLSAGNTSLSGNTSEATSPLLTAVESSSGAIVGSNHMAEFAMSPTGHNQWLGDGMNPRNDDFLSGGSSSGSAIAVAAGTCDVSLGTDTGGSVRLPAAFCGVVGYKPTNGLFSTAGLLPLSESLDTIGIIGADVEAVRSSAHVFFADPAAVDQEARTKLDRTKASDDRSIAHLPRDYIASICDPTVAGAYAAATSAVGSRDEAGVDRNEGELNRCSVTIVSVEAARNVGRMLGWDWSRVGDQVLSRVIRGTAISAIEYADSLARRSAAQRRHLDEAFRGARFLLTPTAPILAPKRTDGSDSAGRRSREDYMRASRFTRITNYLGLPAMTIPLPESDDSLCPGLQIIGRPFDDRALLDVAEALMHTIR